VAMGNGIDWTVEKLPLAKKYFSSLQRPDRLRNSSILLSNGYQIFVLDKAAGHEDINLLPSKAQ
jgi:hypothetical protein